MRTMPHDKPSLPHLLIAFVGAVIVVGVALLAHSLAVLLQTPVRFPLIVLAVLTCVSSRFAIKVPGRAATVSISEIFVFTSALLFGPAAATIIVAVDGAWVSLGQKHRRLHRALFNVAEPAVSTWTAATVFFAITKTASLAQPIPSTPTLALATVVMAGVFFALNSGLTSIALALENNIPVYALWRQHAGYLALNYYAAASLAAVAVANGSPINFTAVGLVAPLLILSYVAYRETSRRVVEAHQHIGEVERLYHASVEMLAIAVDVKDQVTHGHIRRVQRHALAVARALGVTEPIDIKALESGALLHDIGKLAVPDYVLNKPSALTRAEQDTMRKHVTMGARILAAVDFPYPVVPIVRHHHEQWDGRGYPDGLVGAEIPIGARILSVVDCFDALTSDRPYRTRLSDEQAIEILKSRKGTFYDPVIVDTFIGLIPVLQGDDAEAHERSKVQGAVAAGLAGTTNERGVESGLEELLTDPVSAPRQVGALIDRRIARLTASDACLYSLSSSSRDLLVAHATGRLCAETHTLHIPVGSGVSGWVATNRSTIRNADAALDLGALAGQFGFRACTSTPVFASGELFGVLTVYDTREAGFSQSAVADIGVLAQEVGLMLSRIRAEAAGGTQTQEIAYTTVRRERRPLAEAS